MLGISTRLMRKYADGDADAHERPAETRQLGLGYRTAPASEGVLTAGDRAPDARLVTPAGRPVRLFDLFRGPHATVLAFGVPAPDVAHAHTIRRPVDPEIEGALFDADGHAFAAYRAAVGTVVHVRPDGYVADVADVAAAQGSQPTFPLSRP